MIALLLLAQVIQANKPQSSWPAPCRELKQVQMESLASRHVFLPGEPESFALSDRGKRYIRASEALADAMTAAQPDLARIEALQKDVDRLKIDLATSQILLQSQCQMAMLRQLPSDKQADALRAMAPLTREKRERLRRTPPVAPPPPPPPPPK